MLKILGNQRRTCLKTDIKKGSFEDCGTQYLYQWLRKEALYVQLNLRSLL